MQRDYNYLCIILLLFLLVYQIWSKPNNIEISEINSLVHKKILFSGDSISEGSANNHHGWSYYVGESRLLKDNVDVSVGGATLSTSRNDNRIVEQLKPYENQKFDYVILQGGINDAMDSVPLGEMVDSYDVRDFNLSTFAGGLEEYFYYATTYFKSARIGFIINYRTPKAKDWGGYTSNANSYFELAKKIAKKWNIPVLDFYYDDELKNLVSDKFLVDHLHLNEDGYKLTTPYIIYFLETLPQYEENKKIVIRENNFQKNKIEKNFCLKYNVNSLGKCLKIF